MNSQLKDTIEKDITIHATPEEVFAALTDPQQLIQWFPTAIEGEIAEGEQPVMDFGEKHKNSVYVESLQPHTYFAYRWVPGSRHFVGDVRDQPHTLVEFFVEAAGDNTKVSLKESGFASLPAETRQQKFADNTGGWEYMLGRLEKLFQAR